MTHRWETMETVGGFIFLVSKITADGDCSDEIKRCVFLWKKTVTNLDSLENFEHYFTSVWDEYNCAVVWAFFGIAFLWDWNENWPFPVLCHCWVFQICWHIDCCTFTALSFRIWNSSTGILSPPLALLVEKLPKAHLTSHSRMSGSRWVITPSWLSGSWRSFLYSSSAYSCHLTCLRLVFILLCWVLVVAHKVFVASRVTFHCCTQIL